VYDVPGTLWSRVHDAASNKYYYAHRETFEVDWNVPPAVQQAMAQLNLAGGGEQQKSPAPQLTVPEEHSQQIHTTPVQQPPAHRNSYVAPSQDFGIQHDFHRVLDANTQRYYFVNKETQAVQWDVPESWARVAAMEASNRHLSLPLNNNRQSFSTAPGAVNGSGGAAAEQQPNAERRNSLGGGGHMPSKSWTTAPEGQPTPPQQPVRPATMRASAVPPPLPRPQGSGPPSRRMSAADEVGGWDGGAAAAGGQDASFSSPSSEFSPPHTQRKASLSGRAPPPLPAGLVSPASRTGPPPVPSSHLSPSSSSYASPSATSSTPRVVSGLGGYPNSPPVAPAAPPAPPVAPAGPIPYSTVGPPGGNQVYGADGRPVLLASSIKNEIHAFALKSFASNHFRTFKKRTGIVARTVVGVDEVMSWQKDPIAKSLLTSTKKYSSEAVALFKKILTFMGDLTESSRKNPAILAAEIVALGVKTPSMRDEIYCQLAKQTKNNPEPLSAAQGWKLMVLVAAAFAPTRGFQEYVMNYLHSNFASDGAAGAGAGGADASAASSSSPSGAGQEGQAGAILSRLAEWKIQRTIAHGADEKLTLAQLDDMVARGGVRSFQVLFPGNLDYIMYLQRAERNAVSQAVPEIIVRLCALIRDAGGFQSKGIFRIAAQREHVTAARARIEAGNWTVPASEAQDPHTPADVLKVWLRELLTPVVPMNLYDAALRVSDNESECVALVESGLSAVHMASLDYLLLFLAELSTHEKVTLMNSDNLAIGQLPSPAVLVLRVFAAAAALLSLPRRD
jgi:hypothetical protein